MYLSLFRNGTQLTVRRVKVSDSGIYFCQASNVIGSTKSSTLEVIVRPGKWSCDHLTWSLPHSFNASPPPPLCSDPRNCCHDDGFRREIFFTETAFSKKHFKKKRFKMRLEDHLRMQITLPDAKIRILHFRCKFHRTILNTGANQSILPKNH